MKTAAAAALALMLAPAALALPLRASFTPTDPLAPRQYYLAQDHAFDAFPDQLPVVNAVKVAIIDSGIDGNHPEFRGRIPLARSWVGGSRCFHDVETWRTGEGPATKPWPEPMKAR